MLTQLLFGKTPHRLLGGIQAQDDYDSGRANIQSKTAEDLEGGKETKRSIEPKGHTEVLAEYKPQMEQMNEGSVDERNPRMTPLPVSEGTADEDNREPQGPTDLTGGTFSGPNSRDRMDHFYPRPLPDSGKVNYVEKQAHEHHLHPPPCPTWWSSTPGLSKPEMSDQERVQPLRTPPWEEKCDGEWGYEGFTQKAGRPSGPGQGQEGSHQDRGEDDFLKRCHAFSESVAYVHAFGNTHPTAAFTLGVNNMSDWTSEERRYLGGSRAVPVDTEKMLDLDNITLVEALVSGTISYDDAFNVSALSEISADDVERKYRRVVHHRRLPFSSSASNLSDVALPASLDYRYSDANPYGVVAVTSVKYQGTCGSCWAYATSALVEGQIALQHAEDFGDGNHDFTTTDGSTRHGPGALFTRSLSSQQLVDCADQNTGCEGGTVSDAFSYIHDHGLRTFSSYPSTQMQGACLGDTPAFAFAYGPTFIPPCPSDKLLQKALYFFGPLAVHVKSNCPAFLAYASGIFTPDQDCLFPGSGGGGEEREAGVTDWGGQGPDLDTCTREVDHAMLLVGYGKEEPEEGGREFWVLKNTWGTTWGEAGYMRMLRRGGGEGQGRCGTACVGAFGVAAVQGWSLLPVEEWAALNDDAVGAQSTGEADGVEEDMVDKAQTLAEETGDVLIEAGHAIKTAAVQAGKQVKGWEQAGRAVDERVWALAVVVTVVLILTVAYCRWRRSRRLRMAALQVERERARWV